MIGGLIIGHSDIGESILRALKSITGSFEELYCLSNEGLSTDELVEKIKDFSTDKKVDGLLIFIDVYGGSCWRAAKIAKPDRSFIVTGVNLPMMLSFVQKRETFPFDDLPGILETDGKRGVKSE